MTNEELDDLAARSDVLSAIADDLRRARAAIRWLRIIAAITAILTIALGIVSMRVARNSSDIIRTDRTIELVCLAGNESRAGLADLFHFFLDRPPPPDQTPEQARELAEAIDKVDRTLDQRDCSKPPTPEGPTP